MARTGGRDCSNKWGGKSSNGGNSKFGDHEGCFECEYKDHWKHNCPVRKEKQNKMKNAESSSATNVSTGYDTNDKLLMVTDEKSGWEVKAHSSGKSSTSIWILDSDCSFHVCSNKMEFDTYEKRNGSKISLVDKMHDGVVKSLSDREWYLYKAKKDKLLVT